MSYTTKLVCGIILITMPSIQYGGYFLLQVLSGQHADLQLTSFQQSMFRAGHAHAGVLVILSIIAQILVDHASLSNWLEWVVRLGFPLAALLISGGFFGGAVGNQVTEPTSLIWILYVGALLLMGMFIILGVGLIRG